MTQLALASTRRRVGLALVLVFAATLAPVALAPASVAAPQIGTSASV